MSRFPTTEPGAAPSAAPTRTSGSEAGAANTPNPRTQHPTTREDPLVGSSRPPPTRHFANVPATTSPPEPGLRHLTPVTEEGHSRTCSTVVCRPLQWLHLILSTMFAL